MKQIEQWLFTFGYGHSLPGKYIRLDGTFDTARSQMVRMFGSKWAFQYPADKEHELIAQGNTEHKFDGVNYVRHTK